MTENAGWKLRIAATHHVALAAVDFALLRNFYVEVLGLSVVGEFEGHDIAFLDAGSTRIELLGEGALARAPGAGWEHLALEVEDVDEACQELTRLGVIFHVAPEDFPPEAPRLRIAFCKDPEGNVIELVQPLGAPLSLGS